MGETRSTATALCNVGGATQTGGGFSCAYTLASVTSTLSVGGVDEAGQTRTRTLTLHTDDGITTEPMSLIVTPPP